MGNKNIIKQLEYVFLIVSFSVNVLDDDIVYVHLLYMYK